MNYATRDAFVSGLKSPSIHQRLLEDDTLSVQTAFDQARPFPVVTDEFLSEGLCKRFRPNRFKQQLYRKKEQYTAATSNSAASHTVTNGAFSTGDL